MSLVSIKVRTSMHFNIVSFKWSNLFLMELMLKFPINVLSNRSLTRENSGKKYKSLMNVFLRLPRENTGKSLNRGTEQTRLIISGVPNLDISN